MAEETGTNGLPSGASWQNGGLTIAAAAPPAARTPNERTAGLSPRVLRLVARAERWVERREFDAAEKTLREAIALAPGHAEVLRLLAITQHVRQRYAEAIELLRRAAAANPDDALVSNNLGSALAEAGDIDAAIAAFERGTEQEPMLATSWFNLGKAYEAALRHDDAERAFARATSVDPNGYSAHVRHGNALRAAGRLDDAEAAFRRAIELAPASAEAWAGLAGLDPGRLGDADLARLDALYQRADLTSAAHCLIGLARALALEANGRYREAFETTLAVHAIRRQRSRWNAAGASRIVDAIETAFASPVDGAGEALGGEIIFLVGLPRSGSTLAEQILAAHADVTGAGELNDLPQLIREESTRRGVDFPHWVGAATPADWARLGREYLARTARWRSSSARSTDKNLQNWQLVGAIRAMLPGARIVDCRRDPLETCWSALKHQFGHALPFACGIDEIASWWRDYDRLMRHWNATLPGAVFRHDYEALVDDPERAVRALLDACGLAFDPACLAFHALERTVRTASAAQVRAPLKRDTARAERYGDVLDPLRVALGISV